MSENKRGTGVQLAALMRISSVRGNRFPGYWLDTAGLFCVTSGYIAIRLYKPVDGIPECKHPFSKLPLVIADARQNCTDYTIKPPTISAIKKHITRAKTLTPDIVPYELDPGLWVNPYYLMDIIHALPGLHIHIPRDPIKPIYCDGPAGDGVLLPVYIEIYRKNGGITL